MGARLPNLLIVGVTKAGTTSLFSYLAQHPEVCGSAIKETEYFSDLQYEDGNLAPLSAYATHFRHCVDQRYVMEATPNYWYGGQPVRTALEAVLDRPRYIISLRDPVDRFWSEFTYMKSKRLLPGDLAPHDYLDRCSALRTGAAAFRRENRQSRTLSTGFYIEHIPAWLDAFTSRLRVVFFEDLAAAPGPVVADLFGWMGLDRAATGALDFAHENPTIAHRNEVLQRVAYGANRVGTGVLRRVPRLKSALAGAYYAANRGGARTEALEDGLRQRLTGLYGDANRQLADQLVHHGYSSLPAWLHETQ